MRDSTCLGTGHTFFPTKIGQCGLAWNTEGVTRVQLPEKNLQDLHRIFREKGVMAKKISPKGQVLHWIELMQRHLDGEKQTLMEIPVDYKNLPTFFVKVYRELRTIGPGQTITYGELAKRCGIPLGARAVGQAMRRNPFPLVIPCHRVKSPKENLGGFSAYGGVETKVKLLEIEGAFLRSSSWAKE